MKRVTKSALKAKMFEYFRELEKSGDAIVVTDYGKPVLKIVPYEEKRSVEELFKELRTKARVPRDAVLESTDAEWDEK